MDVVVVWVRDGRGCGIWMIQEILMDFELRFGDELVHTAQWTLSACMDSTLPLLEIKQYSNEVEIYFPCTYCHDIIRGSSSWRNIYRHNI